MGKAYRIVIVGAGGLGVPAAWGILELCPPGVTTSIEIYDGENIELSNLNRQVLYGRDDVGKNKAITLVERLQELNELLHKDVSFTAFPQHLLRENFNRLVQADCVLDATDSPESKVRLNDFCILRGINYCYAGAVGTHAIVIPISATRNFNTPCLRCLFGSFSAEELARQSLTCENAGILGPVAGWAGFVQARETWELINAEDKRDMNLGRAFRISPDGSEERVSTFRADPTCLLGCGVLRKKRLDLRDLRCPSTFLYTKLAIEQLSCEETLEVYYDSAQTAENVARSALEHGYQSICSFKESELGHLLLRITAPQTGPS